MKSIQSIVAEEPANDEDAVFIIDDDYISIAFLKEELSERGLENIVTFENPTVALSKIKNGVVPALVITDFQMPELNGVELLKEIEKINPEIPGIIMTSKPSAAKLVSSKWEIIKKRKLKTFIPVIEGKIKTIVGA